MNYDEYNDDDEHTPLPSSVPVISNPADRKKLRGMLEEIGLILTRIEDEKLKKKVILDEIKAQFDIPVKYANGLATTMHKDNYAEKQAAESDFQTLYETIVKIPHPNDNKADFSDEDEVKLSSKVRSEDFAAAIAAFNADRVAEDTE